MDLTAFKTKKVSVRLSNNEVAVYEMVEISNVGVMFTFAGNQCLFPGAP